MVGRRDLRIVGAGEADGLLVWQGQFGGGEGCIPVPTTLRDGRWRLIMGVGAALGGFLRSKGVAV